MIRQRTRDRLAPWAAAVVGLIVWSGIVKAGDIPAFMLPSPAAVALRLGAFVTDPTIWGYVSVTAAEAFGGSLLGATVALPLAIAIHRSQWLSAAVTPFLGATQAIPAIAIAPLLVIWVGYGLGPIVLLCGLMVFFPILVASVVGLRHVDASFVDAARIDGAGSISLLWHIELPLALPSILAGVRNGFTLSVTGAVVGEIVMGGQGLGSLLTVQLHAVDTVGMFATIILLATLASLVYTALQAAERRSRIVQSLQGRSS